MAKRSRRYIEAKKGVDPSKKYEIGDAISLLKDLVQTRIERKEPGRKGFDESVELAIKLGIDPRQSDQLVRGSVSLPKGTGKKMRIVVFAKGEKAESAKQSGADVVGAEDLVKRIESGWLDFDVAIASPDMMRYVGKLGRILGPQGKMPSPKSGTVTDDVGSAVMEFKAGKIEYRTDSGGNVHALVGKLSFSNEDLKDNIESFIRHISNSRPSTVKGSFIQKVSLCSTMSPGIKLAI